MSDTPLPHPTRIGACETCGQPGRLNARICRPCDERYGRRVAELIARARRDPGFAEVCLAAMGAEARAAFLMETQSPDVANADTNAPRMAAPRERPGVRKCSEPRIRHLRLLGPTRSG